MIVFRQRLEQTERERLAPYATKSADSRGRAHPEPEHPYRTAFQRDRDRIIHTTAFRRLKYKTQVFVYDEGDHYRTRISHTLEAAQIGRTIARALNLNEDLTEAITLAHDLGHPPFGHAGERALRELMREYGGFEHNRQGLRIVDELEERYPNFPGLNLTWEVREGIIKHVTRYDRADWSDWEPDLLPTLEAQVSAAADAIAYHTHDLDDGLRAGMLSSAELAQVPLWRAASQALGIEEPLDDMGRHRIVRYLIDLLVTDLLEESSGQLAAQGIDSVEAVRHHPQFLIANSSELAAQLNDLGDYLFEKLYSHPRVQEMREEAQECIRVLFRSYMEDPRLLPPGWDVAGLELPGRARRVTDYIAGMTDRFALQQAVKLGGLSPRRLSEERLPP